MRRITIALAALAITVGACTTAADPPSTTVAGRPSGTTPQAVLASFALNQFDACEAFLDHVRTEAAKVVGPYGLDGYGGYYPPIAFTDAVAATADDAGAGGEAVERVFSGTNVQELGVDEADIVKTDGDRIVALTEGEIVVIDVTGEEPVITGRLRLDNAGVSNLFLMGDTVLTLGSGHGGRDVVFEDMAIAPDYYGTPTVQLTEIDISGEPRVVARMDLDGVYVSSRMINGTVRLVSASGPNGFDWVFPEGSGLRAEREAEEANRRLIEQSTIDNWVPYFILSDGDGDVIAEGNLVPCTRALAPVEFSGFNMLSVTTIDLSRGLEVVDATGVLANGETVYASSESLYVATQRWDFWQEPRLEGDVAVESEGVTTEIHKFDISSSTRTDYVASGTIDGYLLNQFAMSEHEGHLRVASTSGRAWWGESDTESFVTVLEPRGGELVTVGRVGGLGEGEQIFSVRFMGDKGYVVTFRQTDPLYTIDLSDPEDPRMVGELKILGYSAYLHPISENLILGVGQDADKEGRIQGSQLSLFDVSDPANPIRIDQIELADGSNSEVEYDHRAFLYWEGTAVIPVTQWQWDERQEKFFTGAVVVEVDENGLRELGIIHHPGGEGDEGKYDWRAQIRRTVVIDDDLYTFSAIGLLQSDFGSLEDGAWVAF